MDGIILLNKESGWTSFDVVAKIRNTLKTKVGHTGTLDPMATGLLVILLGKACKLEKYLVGKDKSYILEMKFGIKTDTADVTGTKIQEEDFNLSNYSKADIKDKISKFIGKQNQIPPKYSALKHEGESLYRITREKLVSEKELDEILESKTREIEISNIAILDIIFKDNILRLKVDCSSGTYIRSLIEDMAETEFDTIAVLNKLERTSVEEFKIKDSYKIDEIVENKEDNKSLNNMILNIEEAFNNFPKTRIEEQRVYYFKHGVRITNKIENGLYRVYSYNKTNTKNNNNQNNNKANEMTDENIKDKFIGLGLVEEGLMKREYIYEDK